MSSNAENTALTLLENSSRLIIAAGAIACPVNTHAEMISDLLDNGDILCANCNKIHGGGEKGRQLAQKFLQPRLDEFILKVINALGTNGFGLHHKMQDGGAIAFTDEEYPEFCNSPITEGSHIDKLVLEHLQLPSILDGDPVDETVRMFFVYILGKITARLEYSASEFSNVLNPNLKHGTNPLEFYKQAALERIPDSVKNVVVALEDIGFRVRSVNKHPTLSTVKLSCGKEVTPGGSIIGANVEITWSLEFSSIFSQPSSS